MFNTIVGTGATGAGAGAASHYGSGSDQKMRLRLRNTDLTPNPSSSSKAGNILFPFHAGEPLPLNLELLLGQEDECMVPFLRKEAENSLFKKYKDDQQPLYSTEIEDKCTVQDMCYSLQIALIF
jgi:hypothetical protein